MLIRQTFAYLPAQLIGPLAQFATAIVLTHWLGAADYGLTMLIFASQELVFLLCLSWWTFYMMRYSGSIRAPEKRTGFLQTQTTILIASSLLQGLVTALIVRVSAPEAASGFYAAAALFIVSRSLLNLLSERARLEGAIGAYSLIQIAAPVLGLALTLALLAAWGREPSLVLAAFGAVQSLVGLAVARGLDMFQRPGRIDRDILKSALDFGVPILFSNAFNWVAGNGIRFVVQAMRGAGELGLLSVGWGLAGRLSGIAAMVVTAAAYPLAVKAMESGQPDEARRQLSINSALLLAFIAPATAGVIVINEPLIHLLIAPEFQAMTIAILPWALLGASIRNLRMHGWDQLYLLFETPKTMLILDIYEAAFALAGGVIGVVLGGLPGAVIGTVIGTTLVTIGDYLYLRRRYHFRSPVEAILKILIATCLMVAVLLLLPRLGWPIKEGWMTLAATIFLGALAYGLALLALFPVYAGAAFRFAKARLLPAG